MLNMYSQTMESNEIRPFEKKRNIQPVDVSFLTLASYPLTASVFSERQPQIPDLFLDVKRSFSQIFKGRFYCEHTKKTQLKSSFLVTAQKRCFLCWGVWRRWATWASGPCFLVTAAWLPEGRARLEETTRAARCTPPASRGPPPSPRRHHLGGRADGKIKAKPRGETSNFCRSVQRHPPSPLKI